MHRINIFPKIGFFIIIFFILSIFSVAFSKTSSIYQDKKNGFSITFPDDWMIEPASGSRLVNAFAKDKKEKFTPRISIIYQKLPARVGSEELYLWLLKPLRQKVKCFKEIEHGKIQINEHNSNWIIFYRCDYSQIKKVESICYFITRGIKVFLLIGSTSPEQFDDYRYLFDETAQSFQSNLD